MAYMAPEVVGRRGYTWCVDWWSLGVVAWELFFHKRPFDGRTADKMTSSILNDPLKFPSNANELCSPAGQAFLRGVRTFYPCDAWSWRLICLQLLTREWKDRLGCRSRGRGITDVRTHEWMVDMNWDEIQAKSLPPPFVPDVSRACRMVVPTLTIVAGG